MRAWSRLLRRGQNHASVPIAKPGQEGELYRLFLNANRQRTRGAHKWHHYFDVYERFFAPFRGRTITMLEIGVYKGGSLEMWRNYFGPQARIVGLDIDPSCAAYAGEGIEVFVGDQADPAFLRHVLAEIGAPDIVVDDGGHTANQQITSFETIYPALRCPGIYLVEDTHTAFWGGQYADRADGRTFLDFAFDRCRALHEWTMHPEAFDRFGTPPQQRQNPLPPVSAFCSRTGGIAFFDSIVVFERAERAEPWHELR